MFITPCCYITHGAEGELEICAVTTQAWAPKRR